MAGSEPEPKANDSREFFGVIAVSILAGLAVINGVVAVPLTVVITTSPPRHRPDLSHRPASVRRTQSTQRGHRRHRRYQQALQGATIVPARVMKFDAESGSVEPSKRAYFDILDANLLVDIHNIRTIHWVIAAGCFTISRRYGNSSASNRHASRFLTVRPKPQPEICATPGARAIHTPPAKPQAPRQPRRPA